MAGSAVPPRGQDLKWSRTTWGCRSGPRLGVVIGNRGGINGPHRSAAAQTRVERRRIPRVLAWQGAHQGPTQGESTLAPGMVRQTHPHLSVVGESPPKCTDPACAFRFVTAAPPLTRFERGHCSLGFWRQPASACAANSTNVVANALASVGASRTAGGRPSTRTRRTGTTSGAAREPTSMMLTSTPRPGADHSNVRCVLVLVWSRPRCASAHHDG